jgi:hypothetical protein
VKVEFEFQILPWKPQILANKVDLSVD